MRAHLLVSLIIYSGISFAADITLFACERNGEVTLQSERSTDCDKMNVYIYQSTAGKSDPGLRKEEIREIIKNNEQTPSISSQMRRYENIDPRVGWALSNDYIDSTFDKCTFYKARLDSLFALLGAGEPDYYSGATFVPSIDRPEIRQEQIYAAVRHAKSQINYYCK